MHTQARSYTKKAYFCGSVAEVYSYKTPVFRGITVKINRRQRSATKLAERSLSSISRTRVHLRRLVNTNSGQLNKFLTLTFRDNVDDIATANRHLRLYMYRLKRFFPPLQYIAVPEFQKRGAVHYHIMCNLPYTANGLVATLWGHGFTNLRRIQQAVQVGRYIAKYIGKGNADSRLWGKKAYWTSRNLTKPKEMLDKLIDAYLRIEYPKNRVVWESSFDSFRGEVDFSLLALC